jgi:hypothetical protein
MDAYAALLAGVDAAEVERLARVLKAEIGRQWNAQPAPGPDPRDDWVATGGTLDLSEAIRAVLAALAGKD